MLIKYFVWTLNQSLSKHWQMAYCVFSIGNCALESKVLTHDFHLHEIITYHGIYRYLPALSSDECDWFWNSMLLILRVTKNFSQGSHLIGAHTWGEICWLFCMQDFTTWMQWGSWELTGAQPWELEASFLVQWMGHWARSQECCLHRLFWH